MRVSFKILSGEESNREFFLVSGEKIGRTKGAVVLKDSKISSVHCKLSVSSSGVCYLKDLGSSNKIIYNHERVSSLVLSVGMNFTIGKTKIEVTKIESSSATVNKKPLWFDSLERYAQKNIIQNPNSLVAFKQLVRLVFLNGPRLGFAYSLTYGPRVAGFQNQDINLFWSELPKEVFTLLEIENKFFLKPISTNKLYLNTDIIHEMKEVKNGDLLSIDKLKIKIECEDISG